MKKNTPKDYAEINRIAWNKARELHEKGRKINLKKSFEKKDFSILNKEETEKFLELGINNKDIAQLCCNNGRELISLINLGARYGVGFDVSDEFIKEALMYKEISKANCDFIRTNILDISESYYEKFDMIVITVGVLCWIEDLSELFQVASKLLRKGGIIYINDIHPFTNVIVCSDEEGYDANDPLKVVNSYFSDEALCYESNLDYIGGSNAEPSTTVEFNHTISDMLNALIKNNININEFSEFPKDIANIFPEIEKYQKLPLSFIIVGKKN